MITTSKTEFVGSDVMKKIATDESFRRQLEQNPVDALASVGVSLGNNDLPQQIVLPMVADANADSTSDTGSLVRWMGFLG